MKKLLAFIALLLFASPAFAQNTWIGTLGSGAKPANAFGKEGDWFIDTNTYLLWGPKTSGAWPSSGIGTATTAILPAFSGDCTSSAGASALTCTKTSGVAFATIATSASASDLSTGTEPMGRLSNVGVVHCGAKVGANFNITTDQSIAISVPGTKWAPFLVEVSNPSVALDTAVGGIYTAASKGGTALIAANQAYSALTTNAANTSGNGLNLTPTTVSTVYTLTALILSLSTPQGAAATADVDIYCLALR